MTGGMVRPHFLANGDALDRRRMEELFLYVAKRLQEIGGASIEPEQFTRHEFDIDSWEEYQANFGSSLSYIVPDMGYSIVATTIDVVSDDSFFEGVLTWSIKVEVGSAAASNMIAAVPTMDGLPLYAGEDFIEVDQLIRYNYKTNLDPAVNPATDETLDGSPFSNAYGLTLGNQIGFTGLNGRSRLAIVIVSIGKFKVTSCAVNLRKVLR
jgi:hypothetical protein